MELSYKECNRQNGGTDVHIITCFTMLCHVVLGGCFLTPSWLSQLISWSHGVTWHCDVLSHQVMWRRHLTLSCDKGIFQGVSMNFLKYHSGPPCHTTLYLKGGHPLNLQLPARQAACGRLTTPLDTPCRMLLFWHVTSCDLNMCSWHVTHFFF
jgi:hypothetical protein